MEIILADDQVDVRRALKCVLEYEADLQLTAEAVHADELLEYLAHVCSALVLLDWELPGSTGRDLLPRIHAACPNVRVIALSANPEARSDALSAGVQAFASKGDPPECLLTIVREVLADSPTTGTSAES